MFMVCVFIAIPHHHCFSAPGLRPETTSEDIFSASRDGDEYYCREWTMNPENEINITYVWECVYYSSKLCADGGPPTGINMGSLLSITPVSMVMEVLLTCS